MPWKNSWFQLAALVAVISGGLLIADFGPGIYSSLMAAKSVPSTPAQSPSTPSNPTPAPSTPAETTPPPSPSVPPSAQLPVAGQSWTNSLGMKFVPAGTDGVLFCIWDVRAKDYQAFVTATVHDWPKPGFAQTENDPAVNVSWDDAHAFCQWLTKKDQSEGGWTAKQEYRLPTDTEWSKAVGLNEAGGLNEGKDVTPKDKYTIPGVYPWGTQWPPPNGAGNYGGEDFDPQNGIKGYRDGYQYTSPVGTFKANSFGLYDMGGNVWQWCEDRYDNEGDPWRVLRGAAWSMSDQGELLSSARFTMVPASRNVTYGFRVVLVVSPQQPSLPASIPRVSPPTPAPAPVQPASTTPPSTPTPVTPAPVAPKPTIGPVAGQPWTNSLEMKFVPAGTNGVLFCTWDVRVQDFRAYAQASGYQQTGGIHVTKVKTFANGTPFIADDNDPNASWENPGFEQGPTHPVVGVSWDEAIAFCQWLTKKEKGEGKLGSQQTYRLPTGTEWSTAVGGEKYPWGDTWPPPSDAGNYADQAFAASFPVTDKFILPENDGYARTSPVGSFRANAYGLYDMGGNVYQMCMDWSQLRGGAFFKIARGASWKNDPPEILLSSCPDGFTPDTRCDFLGFRVVVVVSP